MNNQQSFKLQLTCSDCEQLTRETNRQNHRHQSRYHERRQSCSLPYYHYLNNLHYFILS
ncbi:MAG: hypothetical protein WBG70_18905 [Spirulinaceae cyanobacterium]